MSKKKILTIAMCVAMAAILAVGTLAYFTDETEEFTNTFTMGNVEIELTEPSWEEPETVEPGVAYDKDPQVENTGDSACWVRMNVTLSDWTAFKAAAATHSITDLTTIFDGHDDSKWTRASITENDDDTVTYSYYFNAKLESGDKTGALFETVTLPACFDNDELAELGKDFTIVVSADAIQDADGFTDAATAFAAFDA